MDAKHSAPAPDKARGAGFWELFTLVKDGRLKSTFLLYVFSLSVVFLVVYGAAYALLLPPLDALLAGRLPTAWINVVESAVPAMAGTLCCVVPFRWIGNRRYLVATYGFLFLYALIALLLLLGTVEAGERGTFLGVYAMFVCPPLLTGCGATVGALRFFPQRMR